MLRVATKPEVRAMQGYVRSFAGGVGFRPYPDLQWDYRHSRPASEGTLYPNQFVRRDHHNDHPRALGGPRLPPVDDLRDVIPSRSHHTVLRGWGQWEYAHYDYIKEPTFPRKPDVAGGELAAGANLIRTDVWHTEGEPAIVSIAKFSPDNFRPVDYEYAPCPETSIHDGVMTFAENRLPIGHADRRPWIYFVISVHLMGWLSFIRNSVIRFLHAFYPPKDASAAGVIDVDLRPIFPGQNFVIKWNGKPVFVRRRTPEMIETCRKDDAIVNSLRDPELDRDRCPRAEWLITIGVCTHLGCIPYPDQGVYGGYFCPCHGSHYDHSGRIRLGPAALNLELAPATFVDDYTVRIAD